MGFYTTTDKGQAVKFTNKFIKLGKSRIVNIYEYDDIIGKSALSVLEFPKADADWLRYIVANRSGAGRDNDFDVVIGPVANDRVYEVIENFEIGDYSEEEAIRRFLTFRLTNQVVFKTEKSLRYLTYAGHELIGE
jgi:hypothetical protein